MSKLDEIKKELEDLVQVYVGKPVRTFDRGMLRSIINKAYNAGWDEYEEDRRLTKRKHPYQW
jgi:hypothetical protein